MIIEDLKESKEKQKSDLEIYFKVFQKKKVKEYSEKIYNANM